MRDKEKDADQMAIKRQRMLEVAFTLFSQEGIDAVSMPQVAHACGYGIATLYRYFSTKLELVVAVSIWAWDRCIKENEARHHDDPTSQMTAIRHFEAYLDRFIELYKYHGDLLRFNQCFNIYVRAEHVSQEQIAPYVRMIQKILAEFHTIYAKAQTDATLRTDVSEEEIFTATIHLMLAAVTRYAVGLVYIPDNWVGAEQELLLLKNMLIQEYTA